MFKMCLKLPVIGKYAKLCFNFNNSIVTAILTPVKPQTIIFRNVSMGKNYVIKPNHYRDKIPEHFTMIYNCRIRRWIQGIQIVPLFFGAVWLYYGVNYNKINSRFSTRDLIIVIPVVCFITALTIYFSFIASRYVLGIYHHEGHFVAVHRSFLGRLKRLSYSLEDVTCNVKKGIEYQKDCDITIRNTKCHIVAADFISPVYYNMHLAGGSSLYTNETTRVMHD